METKFKLILGMLAMFGCLLAASQLHAHESGIHDQNHTCISCDIDDITAHGAAPANSLLLQKKAIEGVELRYAISVSYQLAVHSAIRAPPYSS